MTKNFPGTSLSITAQKLHHDSCATLALMKAFNIFGSLALHPKCHNEACVMAARALLLLLLLAAAGAMSLARAKKQRRIKKVALASVVALQGIVESSAAASVAHSRLCRATRGKAAAPPCLLPTLLGLLLLRISLTMSFIASFARQEARSRRCASK